MLEAENIGFEGNYFIRKELKTGNYFAEKKIISEINIKFRMEDPNKKYHIPIIISKNSYTVWWSK